MKQNGYWNKAMLLGQRTLAVTDDAFGHIDSSIDNVQLHYEPCSTRSRSSDDASMSDSGTPACSLLPETSSHTGGPSCKQAGSAFIADDHLLPHLTIPADVPPLDFSHQPLRECFEGPQTELQALETYC